MLTLPIHVFHNSNEIGTTYENLHSTSLESTVCLKTGRFDLIDFNEFIYQQCSELMPIFEKAGFIFTFSVPLENGYDHFLVSRLSMRRVFHILAENTLISNKKGTQVYISMSSRPDGLRISYKDNGIGIRVDIAKSILNNLESEIVAGSKQEMLISGGLETVFRIIRDNGGLFSMISDKNKGCSYEIFFPRN